MASCRALELHLLPALAPFHRSPRARVTAHRLRASSVRCCAAAGDQAEPPQDAVLKAISQIASSKGRVAQTTNVIMGGTVTDDSTDEWLVLDKKLCQRPEVVEELKYNLIMAQYTVVRNVNTYPTVRGFTAIGTGGDDFVQSMVVAVESVIEERIPQNPIVAAHITAPFILEKLEFTLPHGQISQKVSVKGKYVSVKIGPIRVVSSEQVQAVYNAMKKDVRMKFFL